MKKRRLRRSVGFDKEMMFPARCLARVLFTLLLSLYCTLQLNTASAQQETWTGGSGTDGNWSRRRNWNPNSSAPVNNGTAILDFGASTRTNSNIDVAWSIKSLTFNSGASAYRFSGSMLTLSGGITNNSTSTEIFSNLLAIGSAQTWRATAGQLILAGGLTNRGFTLGITGDGEINFSGAMRGAGDLIKSGNGLLTLSATNTHTGKTIINGGTISVSADYNLGTAPSAAVADKITLNGGKLRTTSGFALNQNRGITVGSAGGNIETTTGTLMYGGIVTGVGTLTKSGVGTLTLAGASTFAGNTFIQSGSLFVNNSIGSGTGSGNVTASTGGTLGGSGIIAGTVTVSGGGTLSPGVKVGTLHTGNEIWNGSGVLSVEIKDAAGIEGVGWDLLTLNGSITVTATPANKFILDLHSLTAADLAGIAQNFDPNQSFSWRIATATGGINLPAGQTEDTVFGFMIDGFTNPLNGGKFSLDIANAGRDLQLIYTPVPEPSAANVLVMGLGILVLVQARDRFTTTRRS